MSEKARKKKGAGKGAKGASTVSLGRFYLRHVRSSALAAMTDVAVQMPLSTSRRPSSMAMMSQAGGLMIACR